MTTTLDDLRQKVWSGGSVTLREWSEARKREEVAAETEVLRAELDELLAEGRRIAEQKEAVEDIKSDVDAFNKKVFKPLREAYAAYIQSRRDLVGLLDSYEIARHPLVTRIKQVNAGIEPPPVINQWAILNLADRECKGEAIQPHVLHSAASDA